MSFCNLVFDTGSLLEDITARVLPGVFNSNDDENGSFDTRSVNLGDSAGNVELGGAGDLGPEGLKVVSAADSPTGRTLLLLGNEVSGTPAFTKVIL
jgi:hypothetical protein